MTLMKPRWLLAVPLLLCGSLSFGSEVRDSAGMFSVGAVRQAKADLDRLEEATKVTTLIETVDSLNGKTIADASLERARASGIKGVYVLISRAEHKLEARDSQRFLGEPGRRSIISAFTTGFKAGNFDDGLAQGVQAIESAVASSGGLPADVAAVPPGPAARGRGGAFPGRVPPAPNPGAGSSGLGILVVIGLVILAVLIGMRVLGSLFGGGRNYQPGPQQMGGPGYGRPGYGAPGYGGGPRGGGFFSGLLGGLGGAMAGNWLYDQFGNRHSGGQPTDSGGFQSGDAGGGGDWGGTSGDWGGGDGGGDWGGDAGGGDWGGGDGGGDGGSW